MIKNIIAIILAFVCLTAYSQNRPYKIVTTQISRGQVVGKEYIEMVVVGHKTCSEQLGGDSIASLSNIRLYDHNGLLTYNQGGDTVPGIASGSYYFPKTPAFDSIPYGSVILVYNDANTNNKIIFQNDSTGLIQSRKGILPFPLYVIPISWLKLVDSTTQPAPDSILQTPLGVNVNAKQVAYLTIPVDTPNFVNKPSYWNISAGSKNETPGYFAQANMTDWVTGLGKVATSILDVLFKVSPNPLIPGCDGSQYFFKATPTLKDSITFQWFYNDSLDSAARTGVDSFLLYHGDSVHLIVHTTLKCITGHKNEIIKGYKVNNLSPDAGFLRLTIKPSPAALVDTLKLVSDTSTLRDSSTYYMTFCKGTIANFTPLINGKSLKGSTYDWYRNGVIKDFAVDSNGVFHDSTLANHDTLICYFTFNGRCAVNPLDTVKIILTVLDSIAPPNVTIKGDTVICSSAKDNFFATFSPTSIGDSTAKDSLTWWVNGALAFSDTIVYKDGDSSKKVFTTSTLNNGDSVQAILLTKKFNSCPYDTMLTSKSNVITIKVTPSITPLAKIIASQDGICPLKKDSILFKVDTTNAFDGNNPIFKWFVNNVYINSDSISYLNPALLNIGDTVSVRVRNTTDKCLTADSAVGIFPLVASPILSPNAAITSNPTLLCAGLTDSVTYTAQLIANFGVSPIGSWLKNGKDVTDTTHPLAYVYKNLSATDTIQFVLLSNVSCAAPKPDTFAVPISIQPIGTPSVSISPLKDSACFGSPITVKASALFTGTAPLFDWYLNGNLVASTSDSTFTFNNPNNGDSAFCHVHSSANCRTNNDTLSNTVYFTVLPLPTVGSISGSQTVCVNSFTTLTDTIPKGGIWSSSSPSTATVDPVTGKLKGLNVGSATISYTITDKYNCQNSATSPLTVSISNFPDITGQNNVCAGQTNVLSISTPGGSWGTSDSLIATVDNNGTVTTLKNGNVVIYDTLNDPTCGITIKSFSLSVGPPIVADIQGLNSICDLGWNTTLTETTPGGFFHSSDTTIAVVDSVLGIVTAKSFGIDTITYSLTNNCGTTTKSILFTVGKPVVSSITGSSSVCTGYTDSLFNMAKGGIWTVNNSSASISTSGVLKGISAGSAVVTYAVTNTCGETDSTFNITVVNAPTRQPISGSSTVCIGKTYQFTDNEPNGVWKSSDSLVATIDPLSGLLKGINNGQATIYYNVENVCGTSQDSTTVVIGAPIIGAFSFKNPICQNESITISSTVLGSTNLIWLSQSPNIANVVDVSRGTIRGVSGGTSTITLIAKNNCPGGISSKDTTLTVVALPNVAAIAGKDSICKGTTTQYTNTATNGVWISDNTTVATVNNSGLVTAVSAGTATISYKVTNSTGCDSTVFKKITVVELPTVAAISGKLSICFGSTTYLNNITPSGVWSIADASVATLVDNVNGVFVGNAGGKSTKVSYTVTNSVGCVNKADAVLTVNAIPNVPSIKGTDSVCINSSITLTNDSLGGVWLSGTPSVASVSNGVVNGFASGTTVITYTVSKNGCDSSVFKTVKVNVNTVGDITGVSANGICLNATAQLANVTPGGLWSTLSKGSITSITSGGLLAGNAVGQDTIKYIVSNYCGITIKAIPVIVGAPTVAAITGNNNVCVGNTIHLSDITLGGVWNTDAPAIATVDVNGNVSGVAAGKANIAYTVINTGGCSFTVTKSITVNALPTVTNIVGSNVVCINNTTTLASTPTSGIWTSVNNAVATISATGVVTPVSIGKDSVYYSYTDINGCKNSTGFLLTVAPLPVVAPITSDTLFVHVGLTTKLLDATLNGVWISQSTDIATVNNTSGVVKGIKEGNAVITYKVTDQNGCIDSSNTSVQVIYQLNDVYVPNFLYPSSSNVSNRTFKVLGKYITAINFKIYTQWGQLLFETSDINSVGWDGTFKGKAQPVGVYVYIANITLQKGEVVQKKGSVNLIR